jgi:cystathionine gamma-synthase
MPGPSTTSIHADRTGAELPDVAPAIRPSTTFVEGTGRRYRRNSHETTERFEAVLGALEGGYTVAYASGMAAVAAVIDHVGPSRIAIPEPVYHGVGALVGRLAARGAIVPTGVDALREGDLWWIETPSNPYCRITDLVAAARFASARGIVTVVDATLATPMGVTPLAFGIDIVMHSTTKMIAGHSDVLGGALSVASEDRAVELASERALTGAVPGSLDVWLALRGLRTLPLRHERASRSAAALVEGLLGRGVPTHYPGLAGDDAAIVASQMRSTGSILSVDLGTEDRADAFLGRLELFSNATSLGGVESLAERRAVSDPSFPPGLVRMSVGIEDTEDLLADVGDALDGVA